VTGEGRIYSTGGRGGVHIGLKSKKRRGKPAKPKEREEEILGGEVGTVRVSHAPK